SCPRRPQIVSGAGTPQASAAPSPSPVTAAPSDRPSPNAMIPTSSRQPSPLINSPPIVSSPTPRLSVSSVNANSDAMRKDLAEVRTIVERLSERRPLARPAGPTGPAGKNDAAAGRVPSSHGTGH